MKARLFFPFNCQARIPIILAAYEKEKSCSEKSELEEWDLSSAMVNRAHGLIVKGKLDGELKKGQNIGQPPEYYQFQVDCFERIKKLGWLPLNSSEKERKKLNDFENSEQ